MILCFEQLIVVIFKSIEVGFYCFEIKMNSWEKYFSVTNIMLLLDRACHLKKLTPTFINKFIILGEIENNFIQIAW